MTTVPETDENGTNHFNDDLDKIAEKETAKEPEKVPAPKVSSAINENKESGDDESGLDDSSDDDAINVVTDPQQAQVSLFPKQTSSMEQVLGAQVQAQAPKVPEGGKRVMIQQGKAPPVSIRNFYKLLFLIMNFFGIFKILVCKVIRRSRFTMLIWLTKINLGYDRVRTFLTILTIDSLLESLQFTSMSP